MASRYATETTSKPDCVYRNESASNQPLVLSCSLSTCQKSGTAILNARESGLAINFVRNNYVSVFGGASFVIMA
jgi:hypothetical protein